MESGAGLCPVAGFVIGVEPSGFATVVLVLRRSIVMRLWTLRCCKVSSLSHTCILPNVPNYEEENELQNRHSSRK